MNQNYDNYNQGQHDDGGYDNYETNSSSKGYKYIIGILVVLLIALGYQYYRQTNMLRGSERELTIERDTLQSRLTDLMTDFDQVKFENDTLNQNVMMERQKADSLMGRLRDERNWSYAKIKKYEKELGTLRTVMKGFVHSIDSLNTVNEKLSKENISYRKQLSSTKLRAEMAEEKSQELQSKIRTGAVVRARDISLSPLSNKGKVMSRASRATMLRVDCVLSANSITVPGERNVFIKITDNSGAILTDSGSTLFEFEGSKVQSTAMREVDYQGDDLAVGMVYKGEISGGTYKVQVFMDGYMIGENEIILK